MARIGRATAVIALTLFFVRILGFFYQIPINYIFGNEVFIYLGIVGSYNAFLVDFCSIGIPIAISRLVAQNDAKNDFKASAQYIFNARVLSYLLLIIAVPIFLFIFLPDQADKIEVKIGFLITIIFLIFVISLSIYRGVLQANLKTKIYAKSFLIETIIKVIFGLVIGYLVLLVTKNEYLAANVMILITGLSSLFSLIYIFKNSKQLRKVKYKNKNKVEFSKIKEIIKTTLPIVVVSILISLFQILDLDFMNGRLGNNQNDNQIFIAYLNVMKIVYIPTIIATATQYSLIPIITRLREKKQYEEIKTTLYNSISGTIKIVLPFVLFMSFYAADFYNFLFVENYFGELILGLLVFINIIEVFSINFNNVVLAFGKYRINYIAVIFGITFKVLFTYILFYYLYVGGIILSTMISFGIIMLIQYDGIKFLKLKVKEIIKENYKYTFIVLVSLIILKKVVNINFGTEKIMLFFNLLVNFTLLVTLIGISIKLFYKKTSIKSFYKF